MKGIAWKTLWKACLQTAAVTVGGSLLLCMLLGWLVSEEWLTGDMCKDLVPIAAALLLFTGCWGSAARAPRRKLAAAVLPAAATVACLLLIRAAAFWETPFTADWRWALPLAAAIGGGLLASQPKKRR